MASRKTEMISFAVRPREKEFIKNQAEALDMKVSEFLRFSALKMNELKKFENGNKFNFGM